MTVATIKNFHLPMPATLYAGLREAATRAGTPATDLARQAIQAWLKEEQRRVQRDALSNFVEANAGSAWDLDPQWEAAGLDSISKLPPWAVPEIVKTDSPKKALKLSASKIKKTRPKSIQRHKVTT